MQRPLLFCLGSLYSTQAHKHETLSYFNWSFTQKQHSQSLKTTKNGEFFAAVCAGDSVNLQQGVR